MTTKTTILVAGTTGNLGKRICKALQNRGAHVRALVRTGSKQTKLDELQQMGVQCIDIESYTKEDCKGLAAVPIVWCLLCRGFAM